MRSPSKKVTNLYTQCPFKGSQTFTQHAPTLRHQHLHYHEKPFCEMKFAWNRSFIYLRCEQEKGKKREIKPQFMRFAAELFILLSFRMRDANGGVICDGKSIKKCFIVDSCLLLILKDGVKGLFAR